MLASLVYRSRKAGGSSGTAWCGMVWGGAAVIVDSEREGSGSKVDCAYCLKFPARATDCHCSAGAGTMACSTLDHNWLM